MSGTKVGVTTPPDVGVTDAPDVGAERPAEMVAKSDKIRLSFQRNCKFELTIQGKVVAIFMPGETKVVDRWIAEHRDFVVYKELFAVQEVE